MRASRPSTLWLGERGPADALVKAFIHALGKADTAALAGLTVSRTEFAYLYYPTAAEGKPPYDLEPGLMWFMLSQRSSTGMGKALQLYGGSGMTLVDYDCGKGEVREGENTIVGPCSVRWTNRLGDTVGARLFSKILERRRPGEIPQLRRRPRLSVVSEESRPLLR